MTTPLAWLIDTNVVSEMMRPEPDERVADFLDTIRSEGIGIASVTVWEVLDGIGRLPVGKRRKHLEACFGKLLDALFKRRIVDWTHSDARECARITEVKRRRGEPLDDHLVDAFLAAAASVRGLGIVTRNVREFRATGATTVNPWAG